MLLTHPVRTSLSLFIFFGSIAVPANAEKIYLLEQVTAGGTTDVKRCNLDGTAVEQLLSLPEAEGREIALDLDNGRMYWTEHDAGKIRRANTDGSGAVDILTGLSNSWGIALDVQGNRIFWTQDENSTDPGVYRAELDGTNPVQLIAGEFLYITLDLTNQKMYLTVGTLQRGPYRANLDGTALEELIPPLTFAGLFGTSLSTCVALDVDGGKMYFGNTGATTPSSIGRADLDGSNPELLIQDVLLPNPDPLQVVGAPQGIFVDTANAKVYWGSILWDSISSADTDGTNIELVYQGAGPVASVALDPTANPAIPTMGGWGVICLSLALFSAGTLVIRRRTGSTVPDRPHSQSMA